MMGASLAYQRPNSSLQEMSLAWGEHLIQTRSSNPYYPVRNPCESGRKTHPGFGQFSIWQQEEIHQGRPPEGGGSEPALFVDAVRKPD
jgi:hypothetical protein